MRPLLKKNEGNAIGLIGHTIVNYPTPALCRESIDIMVAAGVSLIELQIPFSEPMADGPIFMAANHAALAAGVTLEQSMALMREVSARYAIPFVFMTYGNIVFKKGFTAFIEAALASGASGAIVPDLPFDSVDGHAYLTAAKQHDFPVIQLIPPNVDTQRLAQLAQTADGFIYAVARSGVTGKKTQINNELVEFLKQIRRHSDLPVAVGFGISTPEQVAILKPYADYAIIGSQALQVLQQQGTSGLRTYWQALATA